MKKFHMPLTKKMAKYSSGLGIVGLSVLGIWKINACTALQSKKIYHYKGTEI
jgi:hypothetical protein